MASQKRQWPAGDVLCQVAVLIESDDTWGRNVVEAIARYARDAKWSLLIGPRDSQRRLRLPRGWRGEGVIVSLRDQATARHIREAGAPAVDVSITLPDERWLGRVATDDTLRAQVAFEHLLSRGLDHFACYAPPIGRYPDTRAQRFADVVRAQGFPCETYRAGRGSASRGWLAEYECVTRWLETLPMPVAIFASDPYPARRLTEICERCGVRIPDEVALVSGDNDDLLCRVAWPQITSVELASHRIGTEACALLERLMAGESVPDNPVLIAPRRIIERHSTEVLAIADREIADILRSIHQTATEGIGVRDLLKRFPISRRGLEIKFREILGRTPAEEIRRVRLERARALLLETDLSVEAIATRVGFSSGPALSHAFRRFENVTPSEIRNRGSG